MKDPSSNSVLDRQADRSRECTLVLVDDNSPARRDALERIANLHAHTDETLQLAGQARQE